MKSSRQTAAALLVALAACAALAVVPVFFPPGAQWPVVTVTAVLTVVALLGVASPRTARTAAAGASTFLLGLGLFVVFAAVATNYYDERPRPWWLDALWAIAVGLVTCGVVAFLLAALGRLRIPWTHRRPAE